MDYIRVAALAGPQQQQQQQHNPGSPIGGHDSTAAAMTQHVTHSTSSTAANILGLGSDSGPILYMEPNRTSAIEDIRSVIIYISFATLLLGFLIIFPGIRHDKIPTFICIPTSLFVTCVILVALTGTTWHNAEAPISAAYKSFSRDRIQGEISVKIGLQSVNITLRAHKYYILHSSKGPMMMENNLMSAKSQQQQQQQESLKNNSSERPPSDRLQRPTSTATPASASADDPENPFTVQPALISEFEPADDDEETEGELAAETSGVSKKLRRQTEQNNNNKQKNNRTRARTSANQAASQKQPSPSPPTININNEQEQQEQQENNNNDGNYYEIIIIKGQKYSIKRINVDINYNERFYWIEPNQMRQEHHNALKRGLPYPILTVVEYLSQDEAGFSWSRQYRQAGYYTYILLCITLSCCALMFLFHCAAPTYAIYTLQLIGALLILTNVTYALLVPRGSQSLVIPFEGQKLTFNFGFHFWLIFFAGCLALVVGTILYVVDCFWPLTTILDHDFDAAHHGYNRHRKRREALNGGQDDSASPSTPRTTTSDGQLLVQKPSEPPSNLMKSSSPLANYQHHQNSKGLVNRKDSDSKSAASVAQISTTKGHQNQNQNQHQHQKQQPVRRKSGGLSNDSDSSSAHNNFHNKSELANGSPQPILQATQADGIRPNEVKVALPETSQTTTTNTPTNTGTISHL